MVDNKRISAKYNEGLSNDQVLHQKQKGLVNKAPEKITKSNSDIIKDNVFTLFNLLNFLIGVALALVGAYSNMFFLLIILINVVIGIVQEIHSKNLVEKLSLISAMKVKVIRNKTEHEVLVEELVQDDIMLLEMGSQICADSFVVHKQIEVNESLLTGESDMIVKKQGDFLYSGSFVVSGKAYARVEKVGEDSFSSKIISEVQKQKGVNSELLDALRKVTKFTSYIIIPFGIILFLQAYFMRGDTMFVSTVATAAALLGMLPKGLVLLISICSATGVIKLSKRQVLVQEMHCMETLAHVDLLCLDKTGTITEGNMKVINAYTYCEEVAGVRVEEIISAYVQASDDNNATFIALKNYFETTSDSLVVFDKVPFSSDRKWGAISFENFGTIVIGAPEKMLPKDVLPEHVRQAQESGSRALLVAYTDKVIDNGKLPQLTSVAVIELDDPIRSNAKETLHFFKEEGVHVKIISGDNPLTVSRIAQKAGLHDYASFIDMSSIDSEEELIRVASEYSVFGRVSPSQKQQLVKALQARGHTVAMTGDGVNDVLALREADCSIAMAEGNDAAKQISQLVLLNSDFSSLPMVLAEGRRVVNNVTKVSSIFFIKTIYSVVLSVLCMLTLTAFPFIPIQITLIDLAIEGYPSFFLSFEENKKKITGTFLKTSLINALPNALLIIINIIVLNMVQRQGYVSELESVTLMYYMIGFVSILAVLKACLPFNKLRVFLFVTVSVGFYVAVYLFRELLEVQVITSRLMPLLGVLAVLSTIAYFAFTKILSSVDKISKL